MLEIPQAKRVERPAWVNLRSILGLLLFVGAVLGGQRLLGAAEPRSDVWVVAHDLAPGTVIEAADLQRVATELSPALSQSYALGTTELVGATVTRALRAGEMVPLTAVSSDVAGPVRFISLPIGPEHAVGGALRIGDSVDVYATFDAGGRAAKTVLLVAAAEVVEVVTAGGLVSSGSSLVAVSLSVPPEEAGRLAFAIRNAELDLVRVQGNGESPGSSVSGDDFR